MEATWKGLLEQMVLSVSCLCGLVASEEGVMRITDRMLVQQQLQEERMKASGVAGEGQFLHAEDDDLLPEVSHTRPAWNPTTTGVGAGLRRQEQSPAGFRLYDVGSPVSPADSTRGLMHSRVVGEDGDEEAEVVFDMVQLSDTEDTHGHHHGMGVALGASPSSHARIPLLNLVGAFLPSFSCLYGHNDHCCSVNHPFSFSPYPVKCFYLQHFVHAPSPGFACTTTHS